MIATVRLDENLEKTLNRITKIVDKKKSEVIRDAIKMYAETIENKKRSKILNAIEKTKDIDKKEFNELEGTLDDGI